MSKTDQIIPGWGGRLVCTTLGSAGVRGAQTQQGFQSQPLI